MKKSAMLAFVAMLIAPLAFAAPVLPPSPNGQPDGPAKAGDVAAAQTSFALDLYSNLRPAESSGNLFFSPYSIYAALSMTYGGAAGSTAAQMIKVLHIPAGIVLHKALGENMRILNTRGAKGDYTLSIANALWGQKGAKFLPAFIELVRKNYQAGLEQADFMQDAEIVRAKINGWVESKTSGKIKDLIPSGLLKAGTRLVLVNAVYFKGNWNSPFDKAFTQDESFKVAPNKEVRTPLMSMTADFRYYQTPQLQILAMPYGGGDLSMVVILPTAAYGLADLEKNLTAGGLQSWLDALSLTKVEVYFPKFKLTEEFNLGDTLQGMGMKDAFDKHAADFSGMNGKKIPDAQALYIAAVIHKAFVDVDEKGTQAAAATAVDMEETGASIDDVAPPLPVFRTDHPFLFMIRDDRSGDILFLGRMSDPSAN